MSFLPGMHPGMFGAAGLTLSGGSFVNVDSGLVSTRLKVSSDGNVYADEGGGYGQVSPATDWIRPTSAAPGSYEVRYTGHSGDAVTGATEDTWYALTADFELTLSTISGSKSADFTVEIRQGSSGAAIVSGAYSLIATSV